jgi:uncharacterized protein (UPF0332 family)/predicted nucleotidyltransferase|tara:strand:- start:302 stop:1135 length:834 start_codon:yes stop_codon:yes gene_type:complete
LVAKKKKTVKKLESDRDIAYDFSVKAYKKFKEVIKSVVLFGSVSKGEAKKGSDIDIVIIIDDCVINWDQELIAWYRQELSKLISEQKYKKDLHLTTVTLSTFMEEVRIGEPAVINMLRYGETLVDHGGFFNPLKVLLAKGKIRPTPESIFITLRRAPMHIAKAKINIVASIENIYWSMVDSSHAMLMAANQVPPSPEHVSEMLEQVFVRRKILDKKYIEWYNELYDLAHDVMHGNTKYVAGKEIDNHIGRAEEFEKVSRKITAELIKNKKIVKIEKK